MTTYFNMALRIHHKDIFSLYYLHFAGNGEHNVLRAVSTFDKVTVAMTLSPLH